MLTNLTIKNFVIIDNLSIDLEDGLSVITGETGSGKSIIIGALEIALGKKFPKDVFCNPNKNIEISLSLDIKNAKINSWLEENGFDLEDELIIRRILTPEGRNKNYLNNSVLNISLLKDLTTKLINIHGQHDNQLLMDKGYQLKILDTASNNDNLLKDVKNAYLNYFETKKEIDKLESQDSTKSKEELLTFQLKELNEIKDLLPDLKDLEQRHDLLSNSEDIQLDLTKALDLINHEDKGILTNLHSIASILDNHKKLANETLKDALTCINDGIIQIEESNSLIQNMHGSIEYSEEELSTLDSNLQRIYSIAKKHRSTPEDLIQLVQDIEAELDNIQNKSAKLDELKKLLDKQHIEYTKHAAELTKSRIDAANVISKEITKQLKPLDICGPFTIKISTATDSPPKQNGLDSVDFEVKTNPDRPSANIEKIASGGELSRISLAIQAVTSKQLSINTMIFDEVDVGISGATAEIVGKLLKQISEHGQIICITHLAQVAVMANQHLKVHKKTIKGKTTTSVNKLSKDEQIQEIARIIGGVDVTETTLMHAKEMIA